jgi:hypothetical protein
LETRVSETNTNRIIGWTSLPALAPGDNHHFTTIEWGAYLTASGEFKVWQRPGRFVEGLGTYRVNDIIRVEVDPATPAVRWLVNGVLRHTVTPVPGTETAIRYPLRVRASLESYLAAVNDVTTNVAAPTIPAIVGYTSAGNNDGTPDAGETFTIVFSEHTNSVFGHVQTLETTNIDSLFVFNGRLGNAYTGRWDNPSSFTITVVDATGATARVGAATVQARGGPAPLELVIRNAAGTSNPVFSTSPTLIGSARSSSSTGENSELLIEAAVVLLLPGWNLIGLAVQPIDRSVGGFFAGLPVSTVYSVSGTTDTPAAELNTGTGYWVYNAGAERELVFIGISESGHRELPLGWSTVSVPVATELPPGASAFRHQGGSFKPVEKLEPGIGYWLHVNVPTTLNW